MKHCQRHDRPQGRIFSPKYYFGEKQPSKYHLHFFSASGVPTPPLQFFSQQNLLEFGVPPHSGKSATLTLPTKASFVFIFLIYQLKLLKIVLEFFFWQIVLPDVFCKLTLHTTILHIVVLDPFCKCGKSPYKL